MRKLLEMVARGTEAVFKSPGMAAALYATAVAAVVVATGSREDN